MYVFFNFCEVRLSFNYAFVLKTDVIITFHNRITHVKYLEITAHEITRLLSPINKINKLVITVYGDKPNLTQRVMMSAADCNHFQSLLRTLVTTKPTHKDVFIWGRGSKRLCFSRCLLCGYIVLHFIININKSSSIETIGFRIFVDIGKRFFFLNIE